MTNNKDGYNAELLMEAGYASDSPEVKLERRIDRMWKTRGGLTDKDRKELSRDEPDPSSKRWYDDPLMVQREKRLFEAYKKVQAKKGKDPEQMGTFEQYLEYLKVG